MEVVELPEEIMIEILLRSLVKSLLNCKAVCKSWYSIINDTQFIKKHLSRVNATRYNEHKNFLGLNVPYSDASNPCVFYKENSDGTIHAKEFDIPYQHAVSVCNYCDGLICFHLYSRGILLWNPSFPMEYKKIKHSNLNDGSTLMGYDSSTDDYKIVSIPSLVTNDGFPHRYFFIEVFSMRSKSWRKKEISNFFVYEICGHKGIYTRNHLHWIGMRIDDLVYILIWRKIDWIM
ncbi:F-box and associated interaction domains-containing protein [Euphorbia peplus]|nr:F-box and associated interaction domains-containing protein [Euphorbia peplus]